MERLSFLLTSAYEVGKAATLHGGVGCDTIFAGSNDIVDTGEGVGTLLTGFWMDGLAAATVVDFDPAEDVLVYQYDHLHQRPSLRLKTAQIMVDGRATLVIEKRGLYHS